MKFWKPRFSSRRVAVRFARNSGDDDIRIIPVQLPFMRKLWLINHRIDTFTINFIFFCVINQSFKIDSILCDM